MSDLARAKGLIESIADPIIELPDAVTAVAAEAHSLIAGVQEYLLDRNFPRAAP